MTLVARALLADFQARFGAAVTAPLDRGTGTLRANPDAYDAALRAECLDGPTTSADERLAVYNRQYWFRLFGVLQDAFPLTARLLGFWTFNEHAARYLTARPPRGWNIDRVPGTFANFLCESFDSGAVRLGGARAPAPAELLTEAAKLDKAWRDVFAAPEVTPYRPSSADRERLLDARLVASPGVAVFEQHWPLLALRRSLVTNTNDDHVRVPVRLPRSEWWALVHTPSGVGQLPLAPRQGELYESLRRNSVGAALGELEARCTKAERATLPSDAEAWLARGVELGFWCGLDAREE